MANRKDFSNVAQSIAEATKPAAKRGRPAENVANADNGHHLTVYLDDPLFDYLDSMSRITRKSKARYITDLLTADKDKNSAIYANILELQRKI